MLSRRISFHGLLAVLLALMVQLGAGASVPRLDPLAVISGADVLCHTSDGAGGAPAPSPIHPLDCLVCPICIALHAQAVTLVPDAAVAMPAGVVVLLRSELPPPSTAPPSSYWPPSQPRAPPTYS